MSEKYLANRLKYHAASRVAAKEKDPLLNALNLDQHTVLVSKVWASPISEFPKNRDFTNNGADLTKVNYKTTVDGIGATNDLVGVFTNGQAGNFINDSSSTVQSVYFNGANANDGIIYTNSEYPAVKLFYHCSMSPVAGSNGVGNNYEAYELLDSQGLRYMDWVSPVAAFDPEVGKPIPGFTGILEGYKSSTWTAVQEIDTANWALDHGNWEFICYAGLATFNANCTPTQLSVSKLRWTGFLFCGTYLDEANSDLQAKIHNELATLNLKLKNVFAGAQVVGNNFDIDKFIKPGIVRINNNIGLVGNTTYPGTRIPEDDMTGFLQVIEIDHDQDTTANKMNIRIRQIIYPDSLENNTPYSRNGTGAIDQTVYNNIIKKPLYLTNITDASSHNSWDDVDWQQFVSGDICWSEWTTLGGGSNLRRVKLTENRTAEKNRLYYSFGNYTLTLPNPNTLRIGDQVGLEQYSNYGGIVYDNQYQLASPFFGTRYDTTGEPEIDTTKYIGCGQYIFTVIELSDSSKAWYLETATDNTSAIVSMNSRLNSANNRFESRIDAVSNTLRDSVSEASSALGSKLNSASADLTSRMFSYYTYCTSRIDTNETRISALETSVTNLSTSMTNSFKELSTVMQTSINVASSALNASITALSKTESNHFTSFTNYSIAVSESLSAISSIATTGSKLASNASTRADNAFNTAIAGSVLAGSAINTASNASVLASNANVLASNASDKAVVASNLAASAYTTATSALNTASAGSAVAVLGSNLASNASTRANNAYNTASAASSLITAHAAMKHYSVYGYYGALNSASISSQLNLGHNVHLAVAANNTVTLPNCQAAWASSGLCVTIDCNGSCSVIAGANGNELFNGTYTLPFEATLTGNGTGAWKLVVAG